MKNHTKIYLDYFGYTTDDVIPCEICGAQAVDVHHIYNRKSGGDPMKTKDSIDNLMALCRIDHVNYGDVPSLIPILVKIHKLRMANK